MPKISVLVITNRDGFSEILADDMNRQTFRDFEVIVADENYDGEYSIFNKHFKPTPKKEGMAWNLNAGYNEMLDKAEGELLVFLQDYIWIPDDGLEKFWNDYQIYPNALVTGVGHKAEKGLKGISEFDHRIEGPAGLSACDYMHVPWELNWASCPRKIMPRFNEKMDEFYGGENLYIQRKAMLQGATMMIDRNNVCIGYSQAECGGRPADWEEKHCNKNGRLAAFLKYLDLTKGEGV